MHQRHPQFNVEVRLKILEDLEADPRHIYIYEICFTNYLSCHVGQYVCIWVYLISCPYIPDSEVPPAVRAGCHGRMMEENLMWPWLTLFRMKEVTRALKDTDNLALAVRTFCKQGSQYFMGISSFSSLRKKYAWFAFVFRAAWSWVVGLHKSIFKTQPRRDPKIVLWEEESRFVWDALWVWVCDESWGWGFVDYCKCLNVSYEFDNSRVRTLLYGNFASFRCKMIQQFTAWFFIHDRDHSDHCPCWRSVAKCPHVCIDLIGAPAGNWESGLGRKAYEASELFLHVSRTFFLHMHLQPGLLKAISLMNLQQNHVKSSLMRLTESVPRWKRSS